jgi:SNF2 family DNA or RNA helicase
VSRAFGKVRLDDGFWKISAEPHIILKLKRVFGKISHHEHGEVSLLASDETSRDLQWFLQRYFLEISPDNRSELDTRAKSHLDTVLRLEDIVDPNYKPREFALAVPAREYQKRAAEALLARGFLLLCDDVGIGKTASAICSFTDPRTLPAIVVTLSGVLPHQWEEEIRKFAPTLTTHVVKKGTPYPLPRLGCVGPDVVILNYHKLQGWSNTLAQYGKSVVFDEIQELRRSESLKWSAAKHIAQNVQFRMGLSATPIYNYGGEIFNVISVLSEDALGRREEFENEWCQRGYGHTTLKDPKAFGSYLRENFVMMRRTRAEVGRELPAVSHIPQAVDSDRAALDEVEESVAELSRIILKQGESSRGEKMRASEQLSNTLRQATGIAKAPYAADFVRLLVESEERVLVYCWHRQVYTIMQSKLKDLSPAMFTGTETPAQKEEAKTRFMNRETPVLLMSLRAGAGVDGLQKVCRTVVFAELDWSHGVHEQCLGRIHRDGQPDPVTAYFLVAEDGADPVIADILGLKRQQVEGIRNPKGELLEELSSDEGRIRALAERYIQGHRRRHHAAAPAGA